jgi:ComF family protein
MAPFWYEAPLSQLITQFKYHQQWQNAEILMQLFIMSAVELNKETTILPMPSHPARVRQRGCNSVFELLRILVKKLKLHCDYDYLKRIKNTALQADKTESERKRNIKNAFMTNGTAKYRKVILFDDVVTTGATVNEASKCLRKSGVADIEVWTIARTKRASNNYK